MSDPIEVRNYLATEMAKYKNLDDFDGALTLESPISEHMRSEGYSFLTSSKLDADHDGTYESSVVVYVNEETNDRISVRLDNHVELDQNAKKHKKLYNEYMELRQQIQDLKAQKTNDPMHRDLVIGQIQQEITSLLLGDAQDRKSDHAVYALGMADMKSDLMKGSIKDGDFKSSPVPYKDIGVGSAYISPYAAPEEDDGF
jgi:hypothetical protein